MLSDHVVSGVLVRDCSILWTKWDPGKATEGRRGF